ncbi:MAG: signal peptidase I [Spirochaetaceae bacterium]|nr:MAG: signal peptidase I [Spirochaetaceae bacterium]
MITRAAKKGPTWTPLPAILVAVVMAILFSVFMFEPISVDGASMEPGIARGRTVIVLRVAYGLRLPFSKRYLIQWKSPERDAIIVFRAPDGKQWLMKRVAVAVDESIQIHGDKMTVNNNSFLLEPSIARELSRYERIPTGFVFVLGDNLPVSRDSRHFGLVPHSSVLGRVILVPQAGLHERDNQ